MAGKKRAALSDEAPLFDRLSERLEKIAHPETITDVEHWLPSGNYILDMILSNGRGWPLGRMVETYGKTHSGKTTVTMMAGASAQRMGGVFCYAATEPYILKNRTWMEKCGVAPDYVLGHIPKTLEEVLEYIYSAAEMTCRSNTPCVIGWGSVAASGSQRRIEQGKDAPAEAARLISEWFRGDMMKLLHGSKVIIICENQLKVSMKQTSFGALPEESTYGGSAFEFNASIRMRIAKNDYKEGPEGSQVTTGTWANMTCTKNNIRGQGRSGSMILKHDRGPDEAESLAQHLKRNSALAVSGGWLTLGNIKCHGWDQLRQEISTNPAAMELARQAVYGTYNPVKGLL